MQVYPKFWEKTSFSNTENSAEKSIKLPQKLLCHGKIELHKLKQKGQGSVKM